MHEKGRSGIVTELILIPCCLRKRRGGQPVSANAVLASILDQETWLRLCSARVALAKILELEFGGDLEGMGHSPAPPLMPAYRRYDGNLYRSARLNGGGLGGARRLFIVSALYGVLEAKDPIRYYNLQMKDTLPGRVTVKRWWREQGLLDVILNAVNNSGTTQLHDLLSGHCRDALRGLEGTLPRKCAYHPYHYPGLGTGSDFHRGMDLKKLLNETALDRGYPRR